MSYFDIKCDLTFLCFCGACLVGVPLDELSPDPRYCQGCYDCLIGEAELSTRRPSWLPSPLQTPSKVKQVPSDVYGIMSTLEDDKSEMDIIEPRVASDGKRGPKHKPLPVDYILQLYNNGLGSKAIASKLKGELSIGISYKTVQRVLSGERD